MYIILNKRLYRVHNTIFNITKLSIFPRLFNDRYHVLNLNVGSS